jgi:LysM repeat protein
VKPGESLGEIATNFHAKPADIAETNDIAVTDTVDPGDELVIPVSSSTNASRAQFYTIRRGDTLVTVADRFNVSVEDLRKWNHLKKGAVSLGRRLQVSEPMRILVARERASPRMRMRVERAAPRCTEAADPKANRSVPRSRRSPLRRPIARMSRRPRSIMRTHPLRKVLHDKLP